MAKRKRQVGDRGDARVSAPGVLGAGAQATAAPAGVPVVGICSSAGGLDALTRFFEAVPERPGVAFVVVPHLDPTHESMMAELLGRHTSLPVAQAEDGVQVRADHVYVIPPNKSLTIRGGALRLVEPAEPRRLRTAIDDFLRSLARDQGPRAIGVILSGTGSHGALGLKEVKLAGGMVMAQAPESAEYASMPRSAVATGIVDYVLRPEDMPGSLVEYARHPYLRAAPDEEDTEEEREELDRILTTLRARTKFDFRGYRKNMLLRRLRRRMGLRHVREMAEYRSSLGDDAEEVAALHKDLLIGVTAFFREPEAFHVLEQRVLPQLVDRSTDERPVRVWVPACATGEEAYSLGMLLLEAFEAAERPPNVQVFATDIDEAALDVARQGIYPDSIAGVVSEDRLRRFFVKSGEHGCRVGKRLRDVVVFAQQSLISDAPFSRIDLVSCRNLLIYLEPELQAKVVRLFHFALSEDGVLMLGPSESIGRAAGLYDVVSKKWRLYRKVGPSRHDLVDIPISGAAFPRLTSSAAAGAGRGAPRSTLSELAQRSLLADFAPAAVLANARYEALHFHGPTVNYLEIPGGQPSHDLLAMSRPGLRARVRAAILRAAQTGAVVVDPDARVKRDGHYVPCRVTVKPLREPSRGEALFLVTFEERDAERADPPAAPRRAELPLVEQLESELQATREDLQSTIGELESSNEDLKASNEEVMSMNEELQSANEELETSKEELQSMNEELSTVNSELQDKVHDLEAVNNDITNLLSSTDIATLFLDAHLRIKRFTPPTARLLNLLASDVGRPIGDFSAKIANHDLQVDARRVLADLTPIEQEVWSEGAGRRCYLRRIVPYRTADSRIEGVVVTFVDITERRRTEAELEQRVSERTAEVRSSRRRMLSIVETAVDAIATIDADGIVDLFNPAAERMFGYRADEVVGRNVNMLMPPPFADEHDGYIRAYLRTGVKKIIGVGREVVGRRKDGTTFPMDLTVSEIEEDGARRFVGTIRDLTLLRQAQAALEREHAISEGIVSTARAIILRLDRAGRILSFNPYMEELTGYALDEVRGKDWFDTFIPEREQARIKGVFARAVDGDQTRGTINPILTKDGAEVLVEWYDNVLDVPGEPFSLIAIGHDVTARDRLEREFLQAQKMEAVGRLAGGVAHDFNNLLAGITAGLRIASNGIGPAHPSRPMLEQVQEEVGRGASITRRLLDFSRVGKPKPGLIDPREVLSAGERMIRRLLGEDIEVIVDCDASGSRIYADAGQIEQAVLNLAINARDAMPRGGRLELRCCDEELSAELVERLHARVRPGPYVVFSVQDTGCGMDEETRSRALEAFFTTKGPGLGTGLGLSSVATMVEQSGGHLQLDSEPGVGTTVRMFFPRSSADSAAEARRAASADAAAPCSRGDGETILVVEDETLVRLGVQYMLEELGYTVVAARDPETALAGLEREGTSIDLLLTDVVLPGMGGPELAEAVRERCPGVRVLFMSAFPADELVAQGRVAPGTASLEKPFTDEQVAARVRAALSSRAPIE